MRVAFLLALVFVGCRHPRVEAPAADARAPTRRGPHDPVRLARLAPEATVFCAIDANHDVTCWDADTRSRPRAVDGVHGVVEVAVGTARACARDAQGEVRCWGLAAPDGGLATSRPDLAGATMLASGADYLCVTHAPGASCTGNNASGALGTGDTRSRDTASSVLGLTDVAAIAAGGGRACAVHTGGTLECWGFNPPSARFFPSTLGGNATHPIPMTSVAEVREVALGGEFACVRSVQGRVSCWGRNDLGQLGDGTEVSRFVARELSTLGEVAEIAAGEDWACVRRSSGEVLCWGAATDEARRRPTVVPRVAGASDLAVGARAACAIASDGVQCWNDTATETWTPFRSRE